MMIVQGTKITYAACTKPTRCYPITPAQAHLGFWVKHSTPRFGRLVVLSAWLWTPPRYGRAGPVEREASALRTLQVGNYPLLALALRLITPGSPSLRFPLQDPVAVPPLVMIAIPRPRFLLPTQRHFHPWITRSLIAGTDISERTHILSFYNKGIHHHLFLIICISFLLREFHHDAVPGYCFLHTISLSAVKATHVRQLFD
jgi:hypothetical protein